MLSYRTLKGSVRPNGSIATCLAFYDQKLTKILGQKAAQKSDKNRRVCVNWQKSDLKFFVVQLFLSQFLISSILSFFTDRASFQRSP